MKITLAAILPRAARAKATDRLLADYIARTARTIPCESQVYATETELLDSLEGKPARQPGRTRAFVILLDPHGRQLTSEQFAARVGRLRDEGTQRLLFAIGPADGWSATARTRADLLLSLGPLTFPHQLARVVLAEQLYRATTILNGHPYHSGH